MTAHPAANSMSATTPLLGPRGIRTIMVLSARTRPGVIACGIASPAIGASHGFGAYAIGGGGVGVAGRGGGGGGSTATGGGATMGRPAGGVATGGRFGGRGGGSTSVVSAST